MHRGSASCEEAGGARFARIVRWAAARRSLLMAWLTLLALALAMLALARLAEETNYDAVVEALFSIDLWRLGVALVLTAVSFGALTLYDFNAFQAIGAPQPWRRIAPGAVAAYAVAQTAGFGPLSGGAIRLRY